MMTFTAHTANGTVATMPSLKVQRAITVWATLANRSAFKRAVFARVARASASYSVIAARPSRVRSSFLKHASAHRRALSEIIANLSYAATMPQ
jgi:hypothetical protein